MIIKVIDSQTANKLTNAMSAGNCIVLYHMNGCPYCVQMMPVWNNFMQLASKQMPTLAIGEVERSYMDKLADTGVSSFPTIKFYKSDNNPPIQLQQNTVTKQNNFKNILKGIMGQITHTPHTSQNTNGDNSIIFEDARTTDKLIKFAKDNLVKDLNTKSKKTKKTKKIAKKITKKITSHNLGKILQTKKQNLTNSLNKISSTNTIDKYLPRRLNKQLNKPNANMLDLTKYKKAKKNDTIIAKKLKTELSS